MKQFYERHYLKKSGQGPGGQFNGPSLKSILKEDVLRDLEDSIPEDSSTFISYLENIKELHRVWPRLQKNHQWF